MAEQDPEHKLSRRRLLRNTALVASGSFCAPTWASALEEAAGPKEQAWTIGNDLVKRVIAFRAGKGAQDAGLFTQQLSDLSINVNFIPRATTHTGPAEEFSFQCNGRQCSGAGSAFEWWERVSPPSRAASRWPYACATKSLPSKSH